MQSNPDDIKRLRSLRATLSEIEQQSGGKTDGENEAETECREQIAAIEGAWPDERLIEAYRATDQQLGNVEADALAAEIAVRNLSLA